MPPEPTEARHLRGLAIARAAHHTPWNCARTRHCAQQASGGSPQHRPTLLRGTLRSYHRGSRSRWRLVRAHRCTQHAQMHSTDTLRSHRALKDHGPVSGPPPPLQPPPHWRAPRSPESPFQPRRDPHPRAQLLRLSQLSALLHPSSLVTFANSPTLGSCKGGAVVWASGPTPARSLGGTAGEQPYLLLAHRPKLPLSSTHPITFRRSQLNLPIRSSLQVMAV